MTRPAKGPRKRIVPSRKRVEPELPRWRRLLALPLVRLLILIVLVTGLIFEIIFIG